MGEDSVSVEDEVLLAHGYSEWSSHNIETLPVAVVYPRSTEECSEMVKICLKYKIPIIPYSGGSSVEGNFSAPYGGVSFDFVQMGAMLELHSADMDVVVQPSVSWMDLNEKLKAHGLFFPIDPGPTAMIGGMVGTNCSGTNAVRYGTMKDWVVNLTVVLADGQVIKTRRRPRKTSAGYNLTGLFVGSEGTLGIVTEITLKLAPIPEETGVGVVTFPSMRKAAETAIEVIRKGIPVGAIEILDDVQMGVINRVGSTHRVWEESPTLFFKFAGTKNSVQDNIAEVAKVVKSHGGSDFEFAQGEEQQKQLWSARKQALWSMLSLRESGGESWATDVAVPLSRVAELVEVCKKEMDALGLFGSMLGHIGDGNFHETILYDGTKPEERAKVEKCVHDMVHLAIGMEGTCTGEHGIGLGKKSFLKEELGPGPLNVMRAIKKSLDPFWLMNPGKIFDR
ncbi:FAD linked oxidase, domain-containing protein [Cladophialophora immunda]|nr:FAD linked oxidase, domain-containing protein [Cladophialophora immunda]